MNTIEIRKKNPELVARLRESVKAFMDWYTPAGINIDTSDNGDSFYTGSLNEHFWGNYNELASIYSDFVDQSVANDIMELQSMLKKESNDD